MRYLFLVYQDEMLENALEARLCEAIAGESAAHQEQLRLDGQLLMAAVLLPAAALTVRAPNGRVDIENGSRAGASERLAAVWLTEARDLNEAIRLATRMPEARLGGIEVRPLAEQENQG